MEQRDFEFLASVEKSYPPDIAYRVSVQTPWPYGGLSIHFDREKMWKQPQVFVKWTPPEEPQEPSLDCKPTEWDQWNYRTVCNNGWHRTEFKVRDKVESWASGACWRTIIQDTKERFAKVEARQEQLAGKLGCQTKDVFERIKKVADHVYEMELEIYHETRSRISMNCAICGVMRGWVIPLRTPIEKCAELYKLHLQGIHVEIWNDRKALKKVILEKYL
jgi:hypothetical protein